MGGLEEPATASDRGGFTEAKEGAGDGGIFQLKVTEGNEGNNGAEVIEYSYKVATGTKEERPRKMHGFEYFVSFVIFCKSSSSTSL
ncbi:MAG: hypothetical protein QOE70_6111 [Chthoniobacter sp.]|nr:hypothetical protein [Chthoniobacter sp.]